MINENKYGQTCYYFEESNVIIFATPFEYVNKTNINSNFWAKRENKMAWNFKDLIGESFKRIILKSKLKSYYLRKKRKSIIVIFSELMFNSPFRFFMHERIIYLVSIRTKMGHCCQFQWSRSLVVSAFIASQLALVAASW